MASEAASIPAMTAAVVPPETSAQGMWRYRELLSPDEGPIRYPVPVGGTPLLPVPDLRAELGMPGLWVKDETWGPSGSNKDRATALVIESGLRTGASAITTSSTGNAAVSTAFGAAAAGLDAVIFLPPERSPAKSALMRAAGARVFRVADGYRAAFELSRQAARRFGWLDRNTGANPMTLQAKKTVAFEIAEQLGHPPDAVLVPVGDGPTLVGLAIGFAELVRRGVVGAAPRLIGVQPDVCAPLAQRWVGRRPAGLRPGDTIADGIAVAEPVLGERTLREVRACAGAFLTVTDDALLDAVGTFAGTAGVACEPTGAASLAGLRTALRRQLVSRSDRVVLLVTGREVALPHQVPALGEETVISGRLSEVEERLGAVHD